MLPPPTAISGRSPLAIFTRSIASASFASAARAAAASSLSCRPRPRGSPSSARPAATAASVSVAVAAEDQGLPPRAGTRRCPARAAPRSRRRNHGAAAERDRDQVGHPEVGPYAADLHAREDSRGKPLASTPTSVEVPPTSTTIASAGAGQIRGATDPVGRSAADGEHRVPQRLVERHQRAVVLREIRHRHSPCAASASASPCDLAGDTARAAFRMVAFSRSSSPTEPISWLSEIVLAELALDDLGGRSSCRADTGANTLVMATPSAAPPT